MAVKLRLARKGRTHSAFYHIVAADARAPRDGRNLGKLGTYNPTKNPAPVDLKVDAILSWLEKGAQPTATVRQILSSQGILLRRHLQMGVDKGVITQAIADKRFAEWEKIAAKKRRKPYQKATAQNIEAKEEIQPTTPPTEAKPQKVQEASKEEKTEATVENTTPSKEEKKKENSDKTVSSEKKVEENTTESSPEAKAPSKE